MLSNFAIITLFLSTCDVANSSEDAPIFYSTHLVNATLQVQTPLSTEALLTALLLKIPNEKWSERGLSDLGSVRI